MDRFCVTNFRFTMSPEGTWTRTGDRYTFVGPCFLEQEFTCSGSVIYVPAHEEVRMVSVTIPDRGSPPPATTPAAPAATPVATPTVPAAVASAVPEHAPVTDFPPVPEVDDSDDGHLPPYLGKRTVLDLDYNIFTDGAGPSKRRRPDTEETSSTLPSEAALPASAVGEEEKEEEEDCVELVNIESSVEVVDLVSDSEEEEDPSEGSSTSWL